MTTYIEGRCGRKLNNSLTLEFREGPGDPTATALQGGGDGKGRKAAVLFGFKNGGTGRHTLEFAGGEKLIVESVEQKPTEISREDGVTVVTWERGDESVARLSGGTELLRIIPDPVDGKTLDAFRTLIMAPDGSTVGRLDVIRTNRGFSLLNELINLEVWWDRAGQPLKIPILGTRLALERPLSDVERDALFGACVDMAIGLRPYTPAMN